MAARIDCYRFLQSILLDANPVSTPQALDDASVRCYHERISSVPFNLSQLLVNVRHVRVACIVSKSRQSVVCLDNQRDRGGRGGSAADPDPQGESPGEIQAGQGEIQARTSKD